MEQDFTLVSFLRTIIKWKKQIILATVIGGILTALFSWFFLDNYYKSSAIIHPLNMGANDRSVLFNTKSAADIYYYGSKEDVNRVMTIAQSENVRGFAINKYDLIKHYDIDTTKKFWRTKLRKEFENNYKVIKTEQGSVEVSLLDKDPKTAYEIVKDIIGKIDEINRATINDGKHKQIAVFEEDIRKQEDKIQTLNDTLAILGKVYNIIVKSSGPDGEVITGNNPIAVEQYKFFYASQKKAIENIVENKTILEQMKVSLETNNKSIDIIEQPYIADRKEKPVRSVIVALAVLAIFFTAIIAALLAEQFSDIKRQLKNDSHSEG